MALSAKCCASAVAICSEPHGGTHTLKDVADVAGAAAPTEASSSSLTSTTETVFISSFGGVTSKENSLHQ